MPPCHIGTTATPSRNHTTTIAMPRQCRVLPPHYHGHKTIITKEGHHNIVPLCGCVTTNVNLNVSQGHAINIYPQATRFFVDRPEMGGSIGEEQSVTIYCSFWRRTLGQYVRIWRRDSEQSRVGANGDVRR